MAEYQCLPMVITCIPDAIKCMELELLEQHTPTGTPTHTPSVPPPDPRQQLPGMAPF